MKLEAALLCLWGPSSVSILATETNIQPDEEPSCAYSS